MIQPGCWASDQSIDRNPSFVSTALHILLTFCLYFVYIFLTFCSLLLNFTHLSTKHKYDSTGVLGDQSIERNPSFVSSSHFAATIVLLCAHSYHHFVHNCTYFAQICTCLHTFCSQPPLIIRTFLTPPPSPTLSTLIIFGQNMERQ